MRIAPAGPSNTRFPASFCIFVRSTEPHDIPGPVTVKEAMRPFCLDQTHFDAVRAGTVHARNAPAGHRFETDQHQRGRLGRPISGRKRHVVRLDVGVYEVAFDHRPGKQVFGRVAVEGQLLTVLVAA